MSTSMRSIHRVTTLATFIIIALTMTTIFSSINIVTFNSKSSTITHILYDQLKYYEKIAKIINSETVQFDSPEFNHLYDQRRTKQLITYIDSLEAARKQLLALKPEKSSILFFSPRKDEQLPIIENDEAFRTSIKGLKQFITSSPDDFFKRIQAQSSDQILPFSISHFPNKIEESIHMAKKQAEQNLYTSYSLILGAGVFLILVTILIRKALILPAIRKLSNRYEVETKYQREINEQKALITRAIMSIPDITVVLNDEAEIIVSNEAFDALCQIGGKPDGTIDVFNCRLTEQYVMERNVEKLANVLNSNDIIEISGKIISWRCYQELSGIWVFIGRDQTEFTAKQEEKQHAERLEVIGRMASGIAHDFNNILGGILLRAELALEKAEEERDHPAIYRGFIESSLRAKALISQMLSYSRRQILTPEIVSSQTLKDAICASLVTPDNITFKVENHCDLSVNLDVQHCVTAIENIVQNSVLAIGEAAGAIQVDLLEYHSEAHKTFAIKVQDTGGGFPENALLSATEPFFTTRSPTEGSGLGLAMVSGFVAQSGGSLHLENTTGGAIVELRFEGVASTVPHPVVSKAKTSPTNKLTYNPSEKKELCILLEDDLVLGKLLSQFLEKFYDKVEYFNNAQKCTKRLKEYKKVSAAIFDWNLPDGTSEHAVALCRQLHPESMIVLSSGNVDETIQKVADSLDVHTTQKPVSLVELSKVMGLCTEKSNCELV